MAEDVRDTIYVDVDDEITAVIDKVSSSSHKIVALVLPKRAAVFQSIVNMKLLKRKAEEAKKNIVLVTTETSVLPLAGAVGLHVAKTLASKPEIPEPPEKVDQFVDASEDEPINLEDKAEEKADEPVDLAAIANEPVGKLSAKGKEVETIELDNEAIAAEDEADHKGKHEKAKKSKKDKHLRVPNFEKFRLLAFLGIGILIIIVVLIVLAFKVLPKATIDIKTNAQNVSTDVNFTLSPTATSADPTTNTVPAKQVNESKTYTSTVNTTGQQNAQSASGSITITAPCPGKDPNDVPAGTGVSQGGYNYTTQSDASFSTSVQGGSCEYYANTTIVANSAGSGSNTGNNTQFSVNYSDKGITLSGVGSASGGVNATQVVAQADITSAENKVATNNSGVQSDLDGQLNQAGYSPLNVTFAPGTPSATASTAVGGAATTVTVTETINYTLYGVKQSDLTSLLDININSQVSANQSILDTGLSSATFTAGSGPTNLNMQTKAEVGPDINVGQLKHKVVGLKSNQIQSLIMQNSNVTNVTVHFSPFFVTSAPSNTSRITINVAKPTTTK